MSGNFQSPLDSSHELEDSHCMDREKTKQSRLPREAAPPPRLHILHLLLWTLCTAVYLALVRAIDDVPKEMSSSFSMLRHASSLVNSIFVGAALTGGGVLVHAYRRHGTPLIRHPGHWLVLVSAAFSMLMLLIFVASYVLPSDGSTDGVFFLVYGGVYMGSAVGYAFAIQESELLRWKLIFVAIFGMAAMQGIHFFGIWATFDHFPEWSLFSTLPNWGRLLVCLGIVIVSIVDARKGRHRDWLHWIGVATYIVNSIVAVVWIIAIRYIDMSTS